ncbi:hypothetical protein EST38_g14439 [Candolleomyces aberdarensis]|uniref:Myb/SANT-like domain-containing protein n=1 Tax=Candolleomyces aberdarensis TaxID=2316362 RepID=A0A4Q2CZ38_9AGAR|nr:hypothetical protein EST38_g14439 [Candolleomyces aberdarensis]
MSESASTAGGRACAVWDDESDRTLVLTLQTCKASGKGRSNSSFQSAQWAQLKSEYKTVKALREMSGFGWDYETQVVTASDEVWEKLLERDTKKKKWKSTPFPLYDDIGHIVDGTVATGANAFRPGGGNAPPSPAPEVDSHSSDSDDPNSGGYIDAAGIEDGAGSQDSGPAMQPALAASQQDVPNTPAPPAHQLARKCSAIDVKDSAAGYSASSKRKKVSPNAQGMIEITSAVRNLSDGFSQANDNASPARRTRAIKQILDDGYLSDEDELKVFDIIHHDSSFADTLLANDSFTKREHFVQYELKQASSSDT